MLINNKDNKALNFSGGRNPWPTINRDPEDILPSLSELGVDSYTVTASKTDQQDGNKKSTSDSEDKQNGIGDLLFSLSLSISLTHTHVYNTIFYGFLCGLGIGSAYIRAEPRGNWPPPLLKYLISYVLLILRLILAVSF